MLAGHTLERSKWKVLIRESGPKRVEQKQTASHFPSQTGGRTLLQYTGSCVYVKAAFFALFSKQGIALLGWLPYNIWDLQVYVCVP